MPKARLYSLDERCAWLKERMARREAEGPIEPAAPKKKGPSIERVQRTKREVPKHMRMYRVAEVAEMFHVSDWAIRQWFKDRATVVRAHQKHTYLISEQDIEDFIAAHRGSKAAG